MREPIRELIRVILLLFIAIVTAILFRLNIIAPEWMVGIDTPERMAGVPVEGDDEQS